MRETFKNFMTRHSLFLQLEDSKEENFKRDEDKNPIKVQYVREYLLSCLDQKFYNFVLILDVHFFFFFFFPNMEFLEAFI